MLQSLICLLMVFFSFLCTVWTRCKNWSFELIPVTSSLDWHGKKKAFMIQTTLFHIACWIWNTETSRILYFSIPVCISSISYYYSDDQGVRQVMWLHLHRLLQHHWQTLSESSEASKPCSPFWCINSLSHPKIIWLGAVSWKAVQSLLMVLLGAVRSPFMFYSSLFLSLLPSCSCCQSFLYHHS
jgi:hypothetical protein